MSSYRGVLWGVIKGGYSEFRLQLIVALNINVRPIPLQFRGLGLGLSRVSES